MKRCDMKKTEYFNIEKAQAGGALATRAGYPVTVYTFSRRFPAWPIVGVIHFPTYDFVATWTPEGRATRLERPHDNDLVPIGSSVADGIPGLGTDNE